jgi:2-dehydropantoate 2-reductase
MKVAVIGAGAVGGYYGGRLALAGNDVVILARGKTLAALRERPLRVKSINGDFEAKIFATDDPSTVWDVQAVIVAVKTWQLADAARSILAMPGRDSIVVPLQNGMEAPSELAAILGPGRVTGGLCRIVAKVTAPGEIDHFSAEPSVALGEIEPVRKPDALQRLCDAFRSAGVRCDIPPDIVVAMWEKYLFITPWGSLGAVTKLPLGPIRSDPELRARLVGAITELAAIARASGKPLRDGIVEKVMAIHDGLPEDTTASMQRDILAGRPSELEAQTGGVLRLGERHGVPTPIHESMYRALLPLEQKARGN